MIEAVLSGFIAAGTVIIASFLIGRRFFKPILSPQTVAEAINQYINDPAVQEQLGAVTTKFAESLKMSMLGSLGGKNSGLSRQLRAAENEILAEGINVATGFPIGDIAAGYLQKYPGLKLLLPLILNSKVASLGGSGGTSGFPLASSQNPSNSGVSW